MMISVIKKGFSLVELLIVIIIIGILTAIAIPRFKQAYDRFEFDNFYRNIYYLMQYLQNCAIVEKKIYYLNIDEEKAEFMARRLENGEVATLKGRFAKTFKVPEATMVKTDPEAEYICFFPNGRIDELAITFTDKSGARTIIDTKHINNGI